MAGADGVIGPRADGTIQELMPSECVDEQQRFLSRGKGE